MGSPSTCTLCNKGFNWKQCFCFKIPCFCSDFSPHHSLFSILWWTITCLLSLHPAPQQRWFRSHRALTTGHCAQSLQMDLVTWRPRIRWINSAVVQWSFCSGYYSSQIYCVTHWHDRWFIIVSYQHNGAHKEAVASARPFPLISFKTCWPLWLLHLWIISEHFFSHRVFWLYIRWKPT